MSALRTPEALAGVVLGSIAAATIVAVDELDYTAEDLAWLRQLDDEQREEFVEQATDMLTGTRDWAQALLDAVNEAGAE